MCAWRDIGNPLEDRDRLLCSVAVAARRDGEAGAVGGSRTKRYAVEQQLKSHLASSERRFRACSGKNFEVAASARRQVDRHREQVDEWSCIDSLVRSYLVKRRNVGLRNGSRARRVDHDVGWVQHGCESLVD